MPTDLPILVFGAGGHAKVVVDAILASGPAELVIVDDASRTAGRLLLGIPICVLSDSIGNCTRFHVAIGDNGTRQRKSAEIVVAGLRPFTVVHTEARVSPSATVGEGAFLAACCVLGPDVAVETGVVINHGAVVDHDCAVGEFAHVAPNVTLGGGVMVGRLTMVGAGATVLPGVRIGERCVVGAGAVVRRDVADGATVVGVPAREVRR